MEADKTEAVHTDYWIQKWIAIAESVGISKKSLLEDYYFDEFLLVLDAYNDMHNPEKDEDKIEEVDADDWL